MLDRIKRVGNNLVAFAAIGGVVALVAGGLYLTTGSTIPDDNLIANDWENSCRTEVDLQQSGRISLDFSKYSKDAHNQTRFELPTACNDLEGLSPNDTIVNEFRWGSFFTEWGSSSSWDMSVLDTDRPAGADESVCSLELTLRERHRGILTHVFIKDHFNAQTFDWNVPCDVHDAVSEGHNFVTDPFRTGSLTRRLIQESDISMGVWSVEVTGHNGPVVAMQ